jgi:hypothetical protein
VNVDFSSEGVQNTDDGMFGASVRSSEREAKFSCSAGYTNNMSVLVFDHMWHNELEVAYWSVDIDVEQG